MNLITRKFSALLVTSFFIILGLPFEGYGETRASVYHIAAESRHQSNDGFPVTLDIYGQLVVLDQTTRNLSPYRSFGGDAGPVLEAPEFFEKGLFPNAMVTRVPDLALLVEVDLTGDGVSTPFLITNPDTLLPDVLQHQVLHTEGPIHDRQIHVLRPWHPEASPSEGDGMRLTRREALAALGSVALAWPVSSPSAWGQEKRKEEPSSTYRLDAAVTNIAPPPDTFEVYPVGTGSGQTHLFYGYSSRPELALIHASPVTAVAFSGLIGSQRIVAGHQNGDVTLWTFGSSDQSRPLTTVSHDSPVTGIASRSHTLRNGRHLAVGYQNGDVLLWNVPRLQVNKDTGPERTLSYNSPVTSLEVVGHDAPADMGWPAPTMLVGYKNGHVARWDIGRGEIIRTFEHDSRVTVVRPYGALHNPKRIIIGRANGNITLRDINTGEIIKTFEHDSRVTDLDVVSGHIVAGYQDGDLVAWHIRSGRSKIIQNDSPVTSVMVPSSLSSHPGTIVVGHENGDVAWWKLEKLKPRVEGDGLITVQEASDTVVIKPFSVEYVEAHAVLTGDGVSSWKAELLSALTSNRHTFLASPVKSGDPKPIIFGLDMHDHVDSRGEFIDRVVEHRRLHSEHETYLILEGSQEIAEIIDRLSIGTITKKQAQRDMVEYVALTLDQEANPPIQLSDIDEQFVETYWNENMLKNAKQLLRLHKTGVRVRGESKDKKEGSKTLKLLDSIRDGFLNGLRDTGSPIEASRRIVDSVRNFYQHVVDRDRIVMQELQDLRRQNPDANIFVLRGESHAYLLVQLYEEGYPVVWWRVRSSEDMIDPFLWIHFDLELLDRLHDRIHEGPFKGYTVEQLLEHRGWWGMFVSDVIQDGERFDQKDSVLASKIADRIVHDLVTTEAGPALARVIQENAAQSVEELGGTVANWLMENEMLHPDEQWLVYGRSLHFADITKEAFLDALHTVREQLSQKGSDGDGMLQAGTVVENISYELARLVGNGEAVISEPVNGEETGAQLSAINIALLNPAQSGPLFIEALEKVSKNLLPRQRLNVVMTQQQDYKNEERLRHAIQRRFGSHLEINFVDGPPSFGSSEIAGLTNDMGLFDIVIAPESLEAQMRNLFEDARYIFIPAQLRQRDVSTVITDIASAIIDSSA